MKTEEKSASIFAWLEEKNPVPYIPYGHCAFCWHKNDGTLYCCGKLVDRLLGLFKKYGLDNAEIDDWLLSLRIVLKHCENSAARFSPASAGLNSFG